MSFDEVRFPTKIAYGASGGATFSTQIIPLLSGHEKRNGRWNVARGKWNVSLQQMPENEVAEAIEFFRNRMGMLRGFRFRDWTDFRLRDEVIGVGDDVEVAFQVKKTYGAGEVYERVRDITKLVSDLDMLSIAALQGYEPIPWEVYVDDVLKIESVDYSMNINTGIITFTDQPADTHLIKVNGEFDVPVRFDNDQMEASVEFYDAVSWNDIKLIELRV